MRENIKYNLRRELKMGDLCHALYCFMTYASKDVVLETIKLLKLDSSELRINNLFYILFEYILTMNEILSEYDYRKVEIIKDRELYKGIENLLIILENVDDSIKDMGFHKLDDKHYGIELGKIVLYLLKNYKNSKIVYGLQCKYNCYVTANCVNKYSLGCTNYKILEKEKNLYFIKDNIQYKITMTNGKKRRINTIEKLKKINKAEDFIEFQKSIINSISTEQTFYCPLCSPNNNSVNRKRRCCKTCDDALKILTNYRIALNLEDDKDKKQSQIREMIYGNIQKSISRKSIDRCIREYLKEGIIEKYKMLQIVNSNFNFENSKLEKVFNNWKFANSDKK